MSVDRGSPTESVPNADNTPEVEEASQTQGVSRRNFLRAGIGGASVLGAAALSIPRDASPAALLQRASTLHTTHGAGAHPMPMVVGEVDHIRNGFNPTAVLTDFDTGMVTTLPNGQTLHEYTFRVENKTIEVVPGVDFAAWTYNGRIPGPTIRVREGDRVRLTLLNSGDHPHSIHFHGVHPGLIDGVFDAKSGVVPAGGRHVYEFDAEPFGFHLYHCHTAPLAKHIAKGLYGAFIIDPKAGRPRADHELIMVMSGFDVDFDGANDFYQVNGIPFHYEKHPIQLKVGETVRIYLANTLEYDQINSFHLHANFFQYYPTGTSLTPAEFTDTV
ncbi:MAG TPA: multicopper oxidase domain-containing protein, partial [Gemmatimonadaceae bacterium]|nr:multicopper oxidase domain-containing protein [Gemmatimonadaceae bacterium]